MTIITTGSVIYAGTPPVTPATSYPAQLASFDAYYTQNPSGECGPGVCMTFYPISGAEISRYAVFRSIIGFVATIPEIADVSGKTLQVSINLGPVQTILFDGVTPIIDVINYSINGGEAVLSVNDPTKLIFRVDGGTTPGVLEIIGGTALGDFGQTARTISEQSEDLLVTYIDPQEDDDVNGVEYCDPDGGLYDSYRIATVNSSNEISSTTEYITPQESTGKICCIYGLVSDLAGMRIPDAEVRAKIVQYPQSVASPAYIDKEYVTTYSDSTGRFELCLLRCALVHLEIPAAVYHRVVQIPDSPRAAVTELEVSRDYRYPLEIQ